ncbi:hypothetical protein AKJ52_02525 [candidate division MSBL1 archaeon SCGC-AAA382C18]|uniref:ATP--dephospho-CoA triphosphoribosyl transferase CitG n=1 Tax=candidate division MSBL1 archaeon SCGC-AAA382C18 TaxID=1698281 RepID=A0A133VI82_9EURY|nr:hypothetical protein AKJ52_02525 [candidate division MSBL1 archaeon SCGC-AAA382C18]
MLLFVPLSAAAGKTFIEDGKLDIQKLRKNFGQIMKSTTSQDGLNTCKAIQTAMGIEPTETKSQDTTWLGKVKDCGLNLADENLGEKLKKRDISLYDLMETSSKWDGIARELTTRMKVSFETGFPALKRVYKEIQDINIAVVHTFLEILSKHPDTFIARKVGLEATNNVAEAVEIGMKKSRKVSSRADRILQAGGLKTERGKEKLEKLDEDLHKENGKLNPGTTADLTASSTMIAILDGLKY